MVHLGAYGRMRPEDPAGLRRRDVDLDTLRIRVRLAEPERMNGRRVQGDNKHSDDDRQREVAAVLDATVRGARRQRTPVIRTISVLARIRHAAGDRSGQQKGPGR
jgi:integrase